MRIRRRRMRKGPAATRLLLLFFSLVVLAGVPRRAAAVAGTTAPQEPGGPTLAWPARVQAAMTSSFGEYRPGHVHAGLDVKTWGRIGVPMLAVADGRVRRIRTSPWGYGKAIYLELDDGRTAVYAHLDRFIPELEEFVRDRQEQQGRYTVDIWLRGDEFPIGKGEVLAYSGVTATTAPHLHFELRDPQNAPINPLRSGLSVKDSIPPTIQYLVVRPLGAGSRLEGDVRARRFGVRREKPGMYVLRGRPEVEGTVGLSLVTHDRMDGVWNRFGPYRLVLEVDGREVFQVGYDRFTYDASELVDLDRDYGYMVREGIRAHTLYRREGNALTFYGAYPEGAGYLSGLAPGVHTISVLAEDALGNRSRLQGELLVNRPPGVALEVDDGMVRGRASDPDGEPPVLSLEAYYRDHGGSSGAAEVEEGSGEWRRVEGALQFGEGATFVVPGDLVSRLAGEGAIGVRVRAADRWGRESVSDPVTLPGVHRVNGISADAGTPAAGLRLEVEQYGGFLILSARADRPLPGRMRFAVEQGGLPPGRITGNAVSGTRYEAYYPLQISAGKGVTVVARFEPLAAPPAEASTYLDLTPLPALKESRFRSRDGRLEILFPAGTFYIDSFVEEAPAEGAAPGEAWGLIALSDRYTLGPEEIQFRGSGRLTLRLDALPEGMRGAQVGLYTRFMKGGEPQWAYLGGELDRSGGGSSRGRMLEASIGGFGPFAAMADTARPVVELLSPRDGATLDSGRPRIEYSIEDGQTGFSDERRIVLRLNGAQVIARYDPQRDRLIYVPRFDLEPGDYYLTLDATDDAGNLTRHTARFTIR